MRGRDVMQKDACKNERKERAALSWGLGNRAGGSKPGEAGGTRVCQ